MQFFFLKNKKFNRYFNKLLRDTNIMEMYTLQGFYLQNGSKTKILADIGLESKEKFEASLYVNGVSTRQTIRGRLQNIGEITRLDFFKHPPGTNLAELVYWLEKPRSDDFSGKYVGQWGKLPYKTDIYKQEFDLLLAKIDIDICEIRGSAELKLSHRRFC